MTWTERYLAAALKSIPEPKRADVERELRSSIADALEERMAAGEDRLAAERAVLEGLGDPTALAAAYSGKPNYLVGPQLFPIYRHVMPRLMAVIAPLAGVGLAAVRLLGGGTYADAIAAGISGAITAAIQIAFWGTIIFVILERADEAREARDELLAKAGGPWTVERLPEPTKTRVGALEAFGEAFTALITIGAVLFVTGIEAAGPGGARIQLVHPATSPWIPLLIASSAALALLHLVVYLMGRWTFGLAGVHAVVQVAFTAPVVWLALKGNLINPAYATHVGYPALADGNGPVMLSIAVFATLITAWEVFSAFRRAAAARGSATPAGAPLGVV